MIHISFLFNIHFRHADFSFCMKTTSWTELEHVCQLVHEHFPAQINCVGVGGMGSGWRLGGGTGLLQSPKCSKTIHIQYLSISLKEERGGGPAEITPRVCENNLPSVIS